MSGRNGSTASTTSPQSSLSPPCPNTTSLSSRMPLLIGAMSVALNLTKICIFHRKRAFYSFVTYPYFEPSEMRFGEFGGFDVGLLAVGIVMIRQQQDTVVLVLRPRRGRTSSASWSRMYALACVLQGPPLAMTCFLHVICCLAARAG